MAARLERHALDMGEAARAAQRDEAEWSAAVDGYCSLLACSPAAGDDAIAAALRGCRCCHDCPETFGALEGLVLQAVRASGAASRTVLH